MANENREYARAQYVQSPYRAYSLGRMFVGGVAVLIASAYLSEGTGMLRDLIASPEQINQFAYWPQAARLFLLLVALVWLIKGIAQFVHGVRGWFPLLVPPGGVEPFGDPLHTLTEALGCREMPTYDTSGRTWQLAHRFFPNRVPLMTTKTREWVARNIGSSLRAVALAVPVVVITVLPRVIPGESVADYSAYFPSVPGLFLAILLGSAVARFALLFLALPGVAPRADVYGFQHAIAGGGDPHSIPHSLQQVLARCVGGSKSGVYRQGFDLDQSGVTDTGVFEGWMLAESAPEPVEGRVSVALSGQVVVAAVVGSIAIMLTLSLPEAPPRDATKVVHGVIAARWFLGLLGGVVLAIVAGGMFRQARGYLGTFTFRSRALLLHVQGNYSRSRITVGKAQHDSIESENTTVRSDCSVNGVSAEILTEGAGVRGHGREVVSMYRSGDSERLGDGVRTWLDEFQSKGTSIARLDLQDQGVSEIAQANIQLDGRRARAVAAAKREARHQLSGAAPTQRRLTEGAQSPAQGATIPCPDCAELIKAAARKCRFCGYRFS